MSSFFLHFLLLWRICLTQKIEQRLRSTDVGIHKSIDSLYLSCAFLIFYLFKQFQQNLSCLQVSNGHHNHKTFGFLVVFGSFSTSSHLYRLFLILLPSHCCPLVMQEWVLKKKAQFIIVFVGVGDILALSLPPKP